MPIVVCHGGSASKPSHVDGPQLACQQGLKKMSEGGNALDGVVSATQILEDDVRFNAGTGSNLRLDGFTIQMDASCMISTGQFAAVAAIEEVRYPVAVAQCLLDTPQIMLVGDGATEFARQCGFEPYDPGTEGARERFCEVQAATDLIGEWSRADLEKVWNFDIPLREALGCDTVGSLAWDGEHFASALSSGGTTTVLRGRVGDVPLPGCGLWAGKSGAVATTGDGEYIARSLLAYRAYMELEKGMSPQQVVGWALNELADSVDIGIIALNNQGFAGAARHDMAWFGQKS